MVLGCPYFIFEKFKHFVRLPLVYIFNIVPLKEGIRNFSQTIVFMQNPSKNPLFKLFGAQKVVQRGQKVRFQKFN